MKEIYLNYAQYNLWANRRLAGLFSALTEAEAGRHIEGSFPSVKNTVLHIWDAEAIWLKRLRSEKIDTFPSENFSGSFAGAVEGWLANSALFVEHVEGLSGADLQKEQSFKIFSGEEFTHRAFEMIHHCMNHSTFHRGQLITFARQLGLENLPPTDMIFYLREKQRA